MEEIILTERDMEYLRILQEECAEVIQIVSKIQRFGLYSSNPFDLDAKTNLDLLHVEVGDVQALIKLLTDRGVLSEEKLSDAVDRKLKKLPKFLRSVE
jgi:NTP pyrophosphatase (non-canonical NTP hydrolase)